MTDDGQVRPLPCPKCGCEVTTMRFHHVTPRPANLPSPQLYFDLCEGRAPHFHRECTRCSYKWFTTDVLEAAE